MTARLYLVTLLNTLPISVNAHDARMAHRCIHVTRVNCKVGKARRLEFRERNYAKTFVSHNVVFRPIMAADLEPSAHASIRQRTDAIPTLDLDAPLPPLAGLSAGVAILDISTASYLELVDWSAHQVRTDQRGDIAHATPPILARLGFRGSARHALVRGIESRYWRAIGSAQNLVDEAADKGQQWLKDIGTARLLARARS
jgi:hypothetical protein